MTIRVCITIFVFTAICAIAPAMADGPKIFRATKIVDIVTAFPLGISTAPGRDTNVLGLTSSNKGAFQGGELWLYKLNGSGGKSPVKRLGQHDMILPSGVFTLPGGDQIVAMNRFSPGNIGGSAIVFRVGANGNVRWQKEFHNRAVTSIDSGRNNKDVGFALGGIRLYSESKPNLAANFSNQIGKFARLLKGNEKERKLESQDPWIVRLSLDGKTLWQKTWKRNPRSEGLKKVIDVTATQGGDLMTIAMFGERYTRMISRIDLSGRIVWKKTLGGKAAYKFADIVSLQDGSAVIVGTKSEWGKNGDGWLLKIDRDGNTIWETTFGSKFEDTAEGVAVMEDGGLLVGGSADLNVMGGPNARVWRFNKGGKVFWEKKFSDQKYRLVLNVSKSDGERPSVLVVTHKKKTKGAEAWLLELENEDAKSSKLRSANERELGGAGPGGSMLNKDAIAVIIGNRSYGEGVPSVEFAHNDAEAMRKFALDILGYRDGNVIDLRDATQGQMASVFGTSNTHKGKLYDWVKTGKSDVLVFYSGHGVPGLRDKKAYLLPVDGDPNRAEISGYSVDLLYSNLAKLSARSVTVYLDACFSGQSPKGMIIKEASGLSVSPRSVDVPQGFVSIAASKGDQLASWDEKAKLGLFTNHLLEALYGAADRDNFGNGDSIVTLSEVKRYLDEEMSYKARREWGRVQTASVNGDGVAVLTRIKKHQLKRPASVVAAVPLTLIPDSQLRLRPGIAFRDCQKCPEMVVVPAGSFVMGKDDGNSLRFPPHWVSISNPIAVGKYEVTNKEWDACNLAGFCRYDSNRFRWGGKKGDDLHPVSHISWYDAQTFVDWMKKVTSKRYRLLSEAEWEYAARADTSTRFWWGDKIDIGRANISKSYKSRNTQLVNVGSYSPNQFGLHDMIGNVEEWVEDCWNRNYEGAPVDGSAWVRTENCDERTPRGGSHNGDPDYIGVSYRYGFPSSSEHGSGMRLARELK